jgi:hypothetical protein
MPGGSPVSQPPAPGVGVVGDPPLTRQIRKPPTTKGKAVNNVSAAG